MSPDQIISALLKIRGLTSPAEISEFMSPTNPANIASPFNIAQSASVINFHINAQSPIAIYGDYDVDGITSTAILWETIHILNPNTFPFIPVRNRDGYGLTVSGIDQCLEKGAKLIITVDNGITALQAVDHAKSHGCQVVIIDHHEMGARLPEADAILHSTSTCAAALTWFFTRDFTGVSNAEHLSLVSLAVICDIVPLIGINRSFAVHGLAQLRHTNRPGLLALLNLAGLSPLNISAYHVGYVLGPRLNATGRLDNALTSLRLLCTTDHSKANVLANQLNDLNKIRQDLTSQAVETAFSRLDIPNLPSILVVADPAFNEGIIGLVAAKLVEKFNRPAVAISVGPTQAKGSARSVAGVNITDHLRSVSQLLTSVGGHSMAAGLAFEVSKLQNVVSAISNISLDEKLLVKKQRIDLEIPFSSVSKDLYQQISQFEPFGLGNPTPIFLSSQTPATFLRRLGKNNEHLKFYLSGLEAIWFNPSPEISESTISNSQPIFQIALNSYAGRETLQLKMMGLKSTDGTPQVGTNI